MVIQVLYFTFWQTALATLLIGLLVGLHHSMMHLTC